MELSRRSFIKGTAASFGASLAYSLSNTSTALALDDEDTQDWKLVNTNESTNICCYCAGGCGSLCSSRDDELINLEGDPDHPINIGALCPKGASMFQLRNVIDPETREVIKNPNRITKPMVRRPYAEDWEDISWDDAITEIARKVKNTRDTNFEQFNEEGLTVNRCPGIASLGGSQENSEEQYLITKMMRSLGVLAIDNQARVCHSSTVKGLAATFGRGSMTSHWCDFQNADVMMSIGGNCFEAHPVSSKWVHRGVDNGATYIVVDPRYTRSAEMADIYCPLRAGTDIAFHGGLYNYIIENLVEPGLDKYLETGEMTDYNFEYLLNYTNASFLLDKEYSFDVTSGLFSGWDEETNSYSNETWHYQTEKEEKWDTSEGGTYSWVNDPGVPKFTPPVLQVPKKDPTLRDPMCVYQQMKKHYSRYTIKMVCSVCGMTEEQLLRAYKAYAVSAAPDKSGTIFYALGATQHHYGSQNCRAMSVLQLLCGNIGIAGGGVNAMRGEPNVQGATDMGMLVSEQPAYITWPTETGTSSLRKWCESETYSDGFYTNKPKFIVSALKEWWGDYATVENDYLYDLWPKIPATPDYTIINSFELMKQDIIKGYFCWGMNPCHSAPNASNVRECMTHLDWLVTPDWLPTETSLFWKGPGMDPKSIKTTVYYLPAALIYEKPGLIANSGRWLQWRHEACSPWDQAKPDYEMCDLLWKEIVRLYEEEKDLPQTANPDPILKTKWDYYVDGKIDPRPVCWALNGYNVEGTDFENAKVDLLSTFVDLKADGSTSCGMWIYSGFYPNSAAPLDPDQQRCAERTLSDPSGLGLYSNWSFAWPLNRRILYNRASCDLEGKPFNPKRVIMEWTGTEWNQVDVADFSAAKNGEPVPPNNKAFFMLWEQNARLESYSTNDMPFPEHYEPFESPVDNQLNGSQNSPCIKFATLESTKRGDRETYPIAVTTYSPTEHWQSGTQSRSCPALVEAMPEDYCEMSPELAELYDIKNGDYIRVFNNRGSIEVTVLVTPRMKPFLCNGETIHQIGLTHSYGWAGIFGNANQVTNDLSPNVGDANSSIPEYKCFLVDIEKV